MADKVTTQPATRASLRKAKSLRELRPEKVPQPTTQTSITQRLDTLTSQIATLSTALHDLSTSLKKREAKEVAFDNNIIRLLNDRIDRLERADDRYLNSVEIHHREITVTNELLNERLRRIEEEYRKACEEILPVREAVVEIEQDVQEMRVWKEYMEGRFA